ncbi:hypothetical protein MRQ36_22405 [Micromonospora sp. R77]|nr:hypothetical protein [Micromonospora sp. R77]
MASRRASRRPASAITRIRRGLWWARRSAATRARPSRLAAAASATAASSTGSRTIPFTIGYAPAGGTAGSTVSACPGSPTRRAKASSPARSSPSVSSSAWLVSVLAARSTSTSPIRSSTRATCSTSRGHHGAAGCGPKLPSLATPTGQPAAAAPSRALATTSWSAGAVRGTSPVKVPSASVSTSGTRSRRPTARRNGAARAARLPCRVASAPTTSRYTYE